MSISVVVSRSSDGDGRKTAIENELARLCVIAGTDVVITPHLYHISEGSDVWNALSALENEIVLVCWLHPRPAQLLLNLHGIRSKVLDLVTFSTAVDCRAAISDLIFTSAKGPTTVGKISEIDEPVSQRWYPVLDTSRCKNCGHCLQFCLFDVYGYGADGGLTVVNSDNCKPGCPACSRICPEGAIIFPLYEKDQAIAGAPGKFMLPDAAARRMIYMRTRRPCPVCGNVVNLSEARLQTSGSEICEECGGLLVKPQETSPLLNRDVSDDIDLLINDLENLTRRSS
ncbi:MAG: hypothetical protein M1133_11835 [Armatimonadetes bacterium]|nr:hypothetical protein [Armatimonadota bacterium]